MSLWSFGQWRIAGPSRVAGASLVHVIDQAGLRLDRLASIAEAATPAAVALPIPDGYDWFRSWSGLLGDAQDGARVTLASAAHEDVASQVTRSGGQQLSPATDRIGTWIERSYEVLGWPDLGAPIDPPGSVSARPVWPPKVDGIDGWVYCVADGSAGSGDGRIESGGRAIEVGSVLRGAGDCGYGFCVGVADASARGEGCF